MAVPPIEPSESSGPARRMTSGWSHATKRKDLKPSQPGGDDALARRYKMVFRIMLVMAVLAYGGYLVVFVALGVPTLPLVNAIATFLCGVAWFLAERNYTRTATSVMALVVLGHIVPATRVLGWSANFHLFAFLFVTFALLSPHFRIITKVLTVVTVTTGYVFLAAATRHHVVDQPEHVVTLFNVLNTVMFSATLSGLALVYSSAIWKATEKVQALNATLQQLATVDALTGLLNRRSMNELLQREIARFARTGRPFSVVLGDIDDFKVINDIYGHSAGDSALCAAADALREAVREGDHVGRWGGEEFVLLLPETDQKAAAVVAERVQERVRATVLENDGATIHIRMTLGVSMCLEGKSLDEMLVAADQALYDGKRKGKNCIVVAA